MQMSQLVMEGKLCCCCSNSKDTSDVLLCSGPCVHDPAQPAASTCPRAPSKGVGGVTVPVRPGGAQVSAHVCACLCVFLHRHPLGDHNG